MTNELNKRVEELKQQVTPARVQSVVNAPLNPNWIKKRKQGGTELSYVNGATVIRLLNNAFGFAWSFEIVTKQIVESQPKPKVEWVQGNYGKKVRREVIDENGKPVFEAQPPVAHVLGRLTVPGYGVKEQFGSQPLIGGASEQESAFKSASTDAMKKCASLFGIALELYGQDEDFSYIQEQNYFYNEEKEEVIVEKVRVVEKVTKEEPKEIKEHIVEAQQPEEPKEQIEVKEASVVEEKTITHASDVKSDPFPTQEEIIVNREKMNQHMDKLEEQQENRDSVKETKQNESEQVEASEKPSTWKKEDVNRLVELKKILGIEKNEDLNPFLVEFFDDSNANYYLIGPDNIAGVNAFLTNKIDNLDI